MTTKQAIAHLNAHPPNTHTGEAVQVLLAEIEAMREVLGRFITLDNYGREMAQGEYLTKERAAFDVAREIYERTKL